MSSREPENTEPETVADSCLSLAFHIQICGPDGAELGGSFDELQQFLDCHPQVYFEGDGSFGWTGPGCSGPGWSLYGMLYDRDGRMQYAELQGRCPRQVWNQLIAKLTSSARSARITQLPSGQLYALQSFEADMWPATV